MGAVEAAGSAAPKVCPACNSRYGDEVAFCSRDGTPLVADPNAGKSDLAGMVLADRYRVIRLMGEGGMGQVYEAQHVNINKRFAIKLLRPEIVSNPEAVARFRQEAWSASSIGHENIIEIDDFATLPSGAVYLAMEFLRGKALSERMRTPPPMRVDEALDVLLQVCRGLDAAHQKGIVHRDMKPENVFLAEKHNRVIVKILDFGIAKVSGAEGSQSLTRTGTIFGTPHYMSPEQALGRALDHRSDIYSVGVIMYEAFTGRVPFEAESFMGILTKHITVQPTPPRQAAPDREIPDEMEAVILKAMTKEAADRYQSMAEVIADLTRVAEVLAPHVLTLPSGSISAQISSAMPATSSGARPATTPSGASAVASMDSSSQGLRRPSQGVHPSGGVAPAALPPTGQGAPISDAELDVVRPKRRGLVIGLLVAVAGIGVGAFLIFGRKDPQPIAPPVDTPTAQGTKSDAPLEPKKADAKTTPVASPEGPPVKHAKATETPPAKDVIVLVDTEPSGAQISAAGSSLGDTPQNVTLHAGKAQTLTLHKSGYADQVLELDGKGPTRHIVKLVRLVTKPVRGQKAPPVLATKPVVATAPVRPAPPLVASPPQAPPPVRTVRPMKKHDPYERIDEPKKGSDIMNPY